MTPPATAIASAAANALGNAAESDSADSIVTIIAEEYRHPIGMAITATMETVVTRARWAK